MAHFIRGNVAHVVADEMDTLVRDLIGHRDESIISSNDLRPAVLLHKGGSLHPRAESVPQRLLLAPELII